MSGVSGEYHRLVAAALLSLSLHAVILFQQIEYNRKEPTVARAKQQITVSLGMQRVTEKQPAEKTVRRKRLRPIQPESEPNRSKKTDIPSKRQSVPAEKPILMQQPSAKQVTTEREPFASQIESPPVASQQNTTEGQTIRQAVPKYNLNLPPKYPLLAKRRSSEGVTVLEALVDITGEVAKVKIFTTSGYNILDKAAVKAVRYWRFTPGSINGIRKKMWIKIPIRFRLTAK